MRKRPRRQSTSTRHGRTSAARRGHGGNQWADRCACPLLIDSSPRKEPMAPWHGYPHPEALLGGAGVPGKQEPLTKKGTNAVAGSLARAIRAISPACRACSRANGIGGGAASRCVAFAVQVFRVRPQQSAKGGSVVLLAQCLCNLSHRQTGPPRTPYQTRLAQVIRGVLAIPAGAPCGAWKKAATLVQAQRCCTDAESALGLTDIYWVESRHLTEESGHGRAKCGSDLPHSHWGKVNRGPESPWQTPGGAGISAPVWQWRALGRATIGTASAAAAVSVTVPSGDLDLATVGGRKVRLPVMAPVIGDISNETRS